ncbi:MAG: lysophospholipid acyltransferase family protein [Myxococcota bacterium]
MSAPDARSAVSPGGAAVSVDAATPVRATPEKERLASKAQNSEPVVGRRLTLGRRAVFWAYRRLMNTLFDIEVRGELPKDKGAVLASNHPSMADGPLAQVLDPRIRCVAAPQIPLFHTVMSLAGTYFTNSESLFAQVEADLKANNLAWIAPEGTMNSRQISEVKSGAVRMAANAGVEIYPMVMTGTKAAWEQLGRLHTWRPWRKPKITIEIGKPIRPSGETKRDQATVHRAIVELQAKHGIPAACASGAAAATGENDTLHTGARAALRS